MRLEHHFTVPVPPDVAWSALLDPQRVAPCFPGATVSSVDGSAFAGTVKVRLGPIALLYKGKGRFTSTDEQAGRAVLEASGKDSRGNGTASAVVTATIRPDGGGTAVDLATDLTITGRPAQLGRGLIADVGGKIVATFAGCLAERLAEQSGESSGEGSAEQQPDAGGSANPASPEPAQPAPQQARSPAVPSELNLVEVAGAPVLKRLVPPLLGGVVALLILRRLLRRSH